MVNTDSLLRLSGVKKYPKGAVIAEDDSPGNEMYFLLQGSIGAYQKYKMVGEAQTATYGPASFIDELCLFLQKNHTATLVASTDVVAITINRKNAPEFFATQPELTFKIIEGICKKLDTLGVSYDKLYAQVAGASSEQAASRRSTLFPQGHGSYLLPINNSDRESLYEQSCTCPMCDSTFTNLTVLFSRLKVDRTDKDLRTFYKDIEPLYYDIITCPKCFFSASTDSFAQTSRKWAGKVAEEVAYYKDELDIKDGAYRDTFTVFAGYYLALLFAPICCDEHQLISASLWMKLSRLYSDCEDENMFQYTCKQALADYKYAYENFYISEKQTQQLCFFIGDLYFKTGDLDNALSFLYLAKANKEGTNVMKQRTSVRIDEIREIKREARAQQATMNSEQLTVNS